MYRVKAMEVISGYTQEVTFSVKGVALRLIAT